MNTRTRPKSRTRHDPRTRAEESVLLKSARKAARGSNRKGWLLVRDARDIAKW